MKFTFKKQIIQILSFYLFIVIVLVIISRMDLFAFLIIIFFGLSVFKYIFKCTIFMKNNSKDSITQLEQDLSNCDLICDGFYLTDNYIFSIAYFEKIKYEDILVVEGGIAIRCSRMNAIAYKQTLYLKNGKKCIIRFRFDDSKFDKFQELIKKKNNNVYFGTIEDYKKNEIK